MHPGILSSSIENGGRWRWLSRSFGHFDSQFPETAFNVPHVHWSRLATGCLTFQSTLMLTWISNYSYHKVWDEFTYPFPNFNRAELCFWLRPSSPINALFYCPVCCPPVTPYSQYFCHIDGFVQERRNSRALALELHLSCINPSISSWNFQEHRQLLLTRVMTAKEQYQRSKFKVTEVKTNFTQILVFWHNNPCFISQIAMKWNTKLWVA